MKFEDVLGMGKILPIDKLIDIVSKSVGRISKPYFDKKDVETKAYEIKKIAEARAEEMKIIATAVKENHLLTGGIEYKDEKVSISSPKETEKSLPIDINPSMEERTENRLNFQEAKRQFNIENVTAIAAEELKDEPPITDEPLDEDWTTRFFRIVEDVSNEEMQALWGRILAGEIKQPNSYSLRTLDLIRNLSKTEAEVFMKVAKFAIMVNNQNFLFKGKNEKLLSEKYDISYSDTALLTEIGLIQPGTFVNFQIAQASVEQQKIFIAGNMIVIVKIQPNTPMISMPVDVFSTAGNELLKLIKSDPPFEYVEVIAKSIKSDKIDVKHAKFIRWEGNSIRHSTPLQDFE